MSLGGTEKNCVIVGASHAGSSLAFSLRKLGWSGSVTVIGDESHLPYHRPPLSKTYLSGGKTLDQILIRPQAAYEKADVALRLSNRVVEIDRERKSIATASGEALFYSHLVLTTGAQANQLPIDGMALAGVCYLRDASDIERIRASTRAGGHAVVIGGGYIGLEAAATLTKLGMKVTIIEALERVLQRVTSPIISEFFSRIHEEEGVEIRTSTGVTRIEGGSEVSGVVLDSGETLKADLVVVGIGVKPNTELAISSGLAVDNGIVVDGFGRTNDSSIFACGDCANFYHGFYDSSLRLESVQNAGDQASTVAKTICGAPEPYSTVPWFWSDQFDVKLQIAGLSEGYDDIVLRKDPSSGRKFSAFYLKNSSLLAVDAINSPAEFVGAKRLIADRPSVDKERLRDADAKLADCGLT